MIWRRQHGEPEAPFPQSKRARTSSSKSAASGGADDGQGAAAASGGADDGQGAAAAAGGADDGQGAAAAAGGADDGQGAAAASGGADDGQGAAAAAGRISGAVPRLRNLLGMPLFPLALQLVYEHGTGSELPDLVADLETVNMDLRPFDGMYCEETSPVRVLCDLLLPAHLNAKNAAYTTEDDPVALVEALLDLVTFGMDVVTKLLQGVTRTLRADELRMICDVAHQLGANISLLPDLLPSHVLNSFGSTCDALRHLCKLGSVHLISLAEGGADMSSAADVPSELLDAISADDLVIGGGPETLHGDLLLSGCSSRTVKAIRSRLDRMPGPDMERYLELVCGMSADVLEEVAASGMPGLHTMQLLKTSKAYRDHYQGVCARQNRQSYLHVASKASWGWDQGRMGCLRTSAGN